MTNGFYTSSSFNLGTTSIAVNRASSAQSLTGISIDGNAGTVTVAAENSTNATRYPLFSDATSGSVSPKTDSGFTYNPSTGELTAVIVTASSDAVLKEEISTISNALNKVLSLRGVEFTRIENKSREIGVLAQEIEKILPEVVRTNSDSGLKSVAYGNIVGLLIEAIKDQQKEIEFIKKIIK